MATALVPTKSDIPALLQQFAGQRELILAEKMRRGQLAVPDFWTSQSHSTILTQSGGVVAFTPFPWQEKVINGDGVVAPRTDYENLTYENLQEFYPGVSHKELVLKARDVGSSEIWVRFFTWCLLRFGGNVLIQADKEDNAQNLIGIAKQYLRSLPDSERPLLEKDNESEVGVVIREAVYTITAVVRGGGRSERCRYQIKTEVAFWQDRLYEELASSGALVADGYQVMESTANGFNEYHQDWVLPNGYHKTFAGRWSNPAHTPQWWANKVAEYQAKGKEGNLLVEYPETPDQAFLATGLPRFNRDLIRERQKFVSPPVATRIGGAIRIWKPPETGKRYVMGADVAEGKDVGNDKLDWSHAAVYCFETCEHVASIHCQAEPALFARWLDSIGRAYNNALLGVERNNHGHAVLLALVNIHHYPNLYARATQLDLHPGATRMPEWGWLTTMASKPVLEDTIAAHLREGTLTSPDSLFWDEMMSYVYKGNRRTGGQESTHDDRILAHGIALQMRNTQQPVKLRVVQLPVKVMHSEDWMSPQERIRERLARKKRSVARV